MAQAVSRRPLTADTRVRSRVSPCGICGGQRGTATGSFPSSWVFPCQFHSNGAPLLGKVKRIIFLFIFITKFAQLALRLRCFRSFCFGALLPPSKKKDFWITLTKVWTSDRHRSSLHFEAGYDSLGTRQEMDEKGKGLRSGFMCKVIEGREQMAMTH
jgi:hypothetical protein